MIMKTLRQLRDEGASAVEYSILIGGIAAVIIAAVLALGTAADARYDSYSDCLAAQGSGC